MEGKADGPPRCNDVFFAIFFLLHVVGIGALIAAGLAASGGDPDVADSALVKPGEAGLLIGILGIVCGVGFLLSLFWMLLMHRLPVQLIYVCIVLTCLVNLALAVYLFALGQFFWGVLMLVFAVIVVVFFFCWRDRIPFAALLLKTSVTITHQYNALLGVGVAAVLTTIVWTVFWVVSASLTLANLVPGSAAGTYGLFVLMIFSYYWTSQVIENIAHVTTAGCVGSWYFTGPGGTSNPTMGAFRRSVTTSFGSICLGSLIVAVIKTVRAILQSARNIHEILRLCADCILGCLQWIVEYFNTYCFVMIAIYGKSFIASAKDTFSFFKRSGIMALINDNIVGTVLTMPCYISAIVCGAVGGVIAGAVFEMENWVFVMILSAIIGFVIVMMPFIVVDSTIQTLFVCFAEDAEALHRTQPELYDEFVSRGGMLHH
jgi:hypothetical protein